MSWTIIFIYVMVGIFYAAYKFPEDLKVSLGDAVVQRVKRGTTTNNDKADLAMALFICLVLSFIRALVFPLIWLAKLSFFVYRVLNKEG